MIENNNPWIPIAESTPTTEDSLNGVLFMSEGDKDYWKRVTPLTKPSDDASRLKFEAWAKEAGHHVYRYSLGDYSSPMMRHCWAAWQAAIKTV